MQTYFMDDLKRVGAIKYREFFELFLETNQLCIFSSDLTQHWRSRKEWVKDGKPDLDYLSKEFGHAIAPVANCCQTKYSSQVKQDMSVKEFCDYWRSRSQGINDTQTLYLKDWHFCKAFPAYQAYETPVYFKSDWLNEFWDQRSDVADDYRFVYMGPKGSWTPFHADVLSGWHHQVINLEDTISINHNWTNACGIYKMWEHLQSELSKTLQKRQEVAVILLSRAVEWSGVQSTSFPGSSLYLGRVPWLRLVTCLLDFSRFQRSD